jgi:hypothetical protein
LEGKGMEWKLMESNTKERMKQGKGGKGRDKRD